MTDRLELINHYQRIQAYLQASVQNGRPPCPLLAGDLLEVAEQLHTTESTQEFLNELRTRNELPPGPFSGVTGWGT